MAKALSPMLLTEFGICTCVKKFHCVTNFSIRASDAKVLFR